MRFDEDGLYPIVTHAFNFVGKGALGMSRPVTVASRLRKVTDRALRWSLAQSFFLIGHDRPPVSGSVGRASSIGEGMAPSQSVKAREVAVGRDPFAAGLDSQRRMVGIHNEVALRIRVSAESSEDVPVTRPGRERNGVRV